jgi:hypothetical protein
MNFSKEKRMFDEDGIHKEYQAQMLLNKCYLRATKLFIIIVQKVNFKEYFEEFPINQSLSKSNIVVQETNCLF